jgi:hypothetical protein
MAACVTTGPGSPGTVYAVGVRVVYSMVVMMSPMWPWAPPPIVGERDAELPYSVWMICPMVE